jgi:hypothetical protein
LSPSQVGGVVVIFNWMGVCCANTFSQQVDEIHTDRNNSRTDPLGSMI